MNSISYEDACILFDEGKYGIALKKFEILAASGDVNAMLRAADMNVKGLGTEQNIEQAKSYLALAADAGSEPAKELLKLLTEINDVEFDRFYFRTFG